MRTVRKLIQDDEDTARAHGEEARPECRLNKPGISMLFYNKRKKTKNIEFYYRTLTNTRKYQIILLYVKPKFDP